MKKIANKFAGKEEGRGIQKIALQRGRCLKAKENGKTIFLGVT
jgi:hypothetical protein